MLLAFKIYFLYRNEVKALEKLLHNSYIIKIIILLLKLEIIY